MTYEQRKAMLEARGWICGERDPNRNKAWQGRFMVAEPLEEGEGPVTLDASGGAWCVVGDNLRVLVDQTFNTVADEYWV
jgi:hypothetical protein